MCSANRAKTFREAWKWTAPSVQDMAEHGFIRCATPGDSTVASIVTSFRSGGKVFFCISDLPLHPETHTRAACDVDIPRGNLTKWYVFPWNWKAVYCHDRGVRVTCQYEAVKSRADTHLHLRSLANTWDITFIIWDDNFIHLTCFKACNWSNLFDDWIDKYAIARL